MNVPQSPKDASNELKTTDRNRFDIYSQIHQNRQLKEKEDQEYLKTLEESLLTEYKYYKNCRDNKDYSAENLIQETTNKALEQIKQK